MAESTKAGYRALLERRINPKLGKIYVQDLTPRHIRDFYKWLETDPARPAHKVSKDANKKPPKTRSKTGKLSGTSRKHYHQFLSAVLNFAVKSGYIVVNPIAAVNPPRQDTPESEVLEGEDIGKLMEALEQLPENMWKAFFMLDLFTSCRPGELIALNWSDLEITSTEGTEEKNYILTIRAGSNHIKGKGTIRTDRPKTKSSMRTIMLPPEAYTPLLKWKSVQAKQRLKCGNGWEEPDAMFTNEIGRRLYISTPTHKWREIQKGYNLKDVPFYSLRHTGASMLIAAGCDVKEVSSRLGHSRASTTLDTYTHLFEKVQQHTTDVMRAAIDKTRKVAKYVDGAVTVTKAAATAQTTNGTSESASGTDLSSWVSMGEDGSVSFTLADAVSYRTKGASKATPGFDVIDYGQEDYVFGDSDTNARHWSVWVLKALQENAETLEPLFNK